MSSKDSSSWQDTASDWLISIIIAVALAFCIRTFLVEPYMVEGTSMYPTLKNHERLVVDKLNHYISNPARGEIIVFRYPQDESRDFIKRVIAVPGDRVRMESGQVYVNDEALNEQYIYLDDPKGRNMSSYPETVIPEGHVFVLGDNRNNSVDSRFPNVGLVEDRLIKGRAVLAFWPLDEFHVIHADNGLNK